MGKFILFLLSESIHSFSWTDGRGRWAHFWAKDSPPSRENGIKSIKIKFIFTIRHRQFGRSGTNESDKKENSNEFHRRYCLIKNFHGKSSEWKDQLSETRTKINCFIPSKLSWTRTHYQLKHRLTARNRSWLLLSADGFLIKTW